MNPLFIIGMPRSGTKLLREILSRHALVSIPKAETGFIPYYYSRRFKFGDLNNRENFKKFYREFKNSSFYYHINQADKIWNESSLYRNSNSRSISDVIDAIFRMHADYENKSFWGDKSPEYIYHTRLIKRLFPDARFVHIIRDARDCCLSTRKAWNKNIFRAAQKWVKGVELARKEGSVLKNDYFELKYEDLIDKPESEMTALCDWLGLKYTPKMLDLDQQVENLGDAKNEFGILRHNYKKWQIKLSRREIRKIEAIAGETLFKLGYEVKFIRGHKQLTRREDLIFIISDIFNLFVFRRKEYNSMILASVRLFRDLKTKIYQAGQK